MITLGDFGFLRKFICRFINKSGGFALTFGFAVNTVAGQTFGHSNQCQTC